MFGMVLLLLFSQNILAANTQDAIQVLININRAYPALHSLITAFCYLMGFALIIRGVFYLKMYGELRTMMSTQTSVKIPIVLIFVGSVLIFIPTTYTTLSLSFFGTSSVLRYDQVSSSMDPRLLEAIVGIIQLIGLISFIKGWMILVANAQQPGGQATVGKAATHIIGGLCAYNILGFTNIIWNTLYGENLF